MIADFSFYVLAEHHSDVAVNNQLVAVSSSVDGINGYLRGHPVKA